MSYAQRQALLELKSVLLRAQALIDLIESKPTLTVSASRAVNQIANMRHWPVHGPRSSRPEED